jgi:ABC-2 type transport system permease protein
LEFKGFDVTAFPIHDIFPNTDIYRKGFNCNVFTRRIHLTYLGSWALVFNAIYLESRDESLSSFWKIIMKMIKRYIKIWWMLTRNSFSIVLGHRTALSIFLFGKILRFIFFMTFLTFLIIGAKNLAGYNANQVIFFFLTFSLVDTMSQFLFREAHRFRSKVINGDFDLTLVKPLNALFVSVMGGADIIDFITIPPLLLLVIHYGSLLDPSFISTIFYLVLVLNGILIAGAFYIAVLSLGIITLEIDHTVMIFRDLESLGRFPVDIYKQPLQNILTYLLPIGVMVTIPAKALMGLVSPGGVVGSFMIGLLALYVSLKFWNLALKKYTSASS